MYFKGEQKICTDQSWIKHRFFFFDKLHFVTSKSVPTVVLKSNLEHKLTFTELSIETLILRDKTYIWMSTKHTGCVNIQNPFYRKIGNYRQKNAFEPLKSFKKQRILYRGNYCSHHYSILKYYPSRNLWYCILRFKREE